MQALHSNSRVVAQPIFHSHFCHFTNIVSHIPPKQHYPFPQISCPSPLSLKNLNFSYPIEIRPTIKAFSSSSSMASSAPSSAETKPFSVLFVCLGNICRSPAAEGVFRDMVTKKGLDSNFNIDSAGTIDFHEGNPADSRMISTAKRRGVEITSISRPIRPSDFRDFDLILAMDESNKANILKALDGWKRRETLPPDADKKVKLMCSYCKKHDETEVPDPYYGGQQGFEKVLDLLEDACESLLETILTESQQT
ncbi:uncharacterized protein LOC104900354 [Beta vulgaris subsp. vulgaris]|uniref:uncharacterized protein LOC104900354 n=1 Tax=Beta vulgaris subsp. vulgaris TaxID=3555 RepID=UPI00053F2EBD|nr:uncharacterized protein LOC104900354 [Beta vulgaris subsp. vulgaris]